MDNYQMTLGEFRARTVGLPDSAPLVANVNHGDDTGSDLRTVIEVDVARMIVEPFAEVILDCSPPDPE